MLWVSVAGVHVTMVCMSLGLDGSTSASERERLINQFNDPENNTAWVFLLSTRYGPLLSFFLIFSGAFSIHFLFLERVAWG